MEAGKLNRRISILQQSSSQDSFGQPITTWTSLLDTWGSINVMKTQLLYSTAEFVSKASYTIAIRWTPVLIQARNRVSYTDPATGTTHIYEIQEVLNDRQQNRQINLVVYELDGSQ